MKKLLLILSFILLNVGFYFSGKYLPGLINYILLNTAVSSVTNYFVFGALGVLLSIIAFFCIIRIYSRADEGGMGITLAICVILTVAGLFPAVEMKLLGTNHLYTLVNNFKDWLFRLLKIK